MTLTHDYATRRAESVFTDALDTWKNGFYAMSAPMQAFPTSVTFPQFDVTDAVERQFKFIQKVVDVNYGYALQLAEASNTVAGAVRQHIEGLNAAFVEQVQGVSEVAQSTVESFEESVRETAEEVQRAQREARDQVEQVEQDAAAKAEQAEREQVREARKAAREHYRSLTRNELADEAAKRNLPKTGTVDVLVHRLVEDDTNK
jgi:uncharacterized protein YoxC